MVCGNAGTSENLFALRHSLRSAELLTQILRHSYYSALKTQVLYRSLTSYNNTVVQTVLFLTSLAKLSPPSWSKRYD